MEVLMEGSVSDLMETAMAELKEVQKGTAVLDLGSDLMEGRKLAERAMETPVVYSASEEVKEMEKVTANQMEISEEEHRLVEVLVYLVLLFRESVVS